MSAEDRVAAALRALAAQAGPAPDGEARLGRRLRREHRRRRTAAVAGSVMVAVGVAALAAVLGAARPSAAPTPAPFASAAPSPAPSRLPTAGPQAPSPPPWTYAPPGPDVGGPEWLMAVEDGGTWGVRDARSGAVAATGSPRDYAVTDVAAAGDGKTFYFAAVQKRAEGCGTSLLQQLVFKQAGRTDDVAVSDVASEAPLDGEIGSIAVSHDGTRLAYAVATRVDVDYRSCGIFDLRVVDLRTGRTRTWTGGEATPSALTWAPDDSTLLLHVNPCCGDYDPGVSRLDTEGAGTTFDELPITPGTDDLMECGVSSTASTATEVFAVQECYGGTAPGALHVVVLDPVSGRVVRRLATVEGTDSVPSLAVSADGRHLLLSQRGEQTRRNLRIDDGTVSQLPTSLERLVW